MPASHVAIYNDLRGPNNSLTLREAVAHAALLEAFQIIRQGRADVMLVGATGTRIHPMKMVHAAQTEELAKVNGDPSKASRPFDRYRTGMVLGEGAGAIVLEDLSRALARGATIHAEVLGGATTAAVSRNLQARRDVAMRNALARALSSAGLQPEQIGHVQAHGLGTRSCDIEESRAICDIFGGRISPVPVTAVKSYTGNLGAGSGMVELEAGVLALKQGTVFPLLNYAHPDPECPVAAVTEGGTYSGGSFISLSVTPQGQASAAVVRRFEG
jgi:3-oxoacyl-[acyl-carrier-protein] synthase II